MTVLSCVQGGGWGGGCPVGEEPGDRAAVCFRPSRRPRSSGGWRRLAQGEVEPLRLSEWAAILLSDDVQAERDRDRRLALSLLIAGHGDATRPKV